VPVHRHPSRSRARHQRRSLLALVLAVAIGIVLGGITYLTAHAAPKKPGNAAEHKNMQLVGSDELQGRSAYQPTIHHYSDGRDIAFVGHHGGTSPTVGGSNGTSIVDVTNPAHPVYLVHIPGGAGSGEAGGAEMVRVCDGLAGTPGAGHVYMLRATSTSHELYDVTDPGAPGAPLVVSGPFSATHKNEWECSTGIAYLVSAVPGWRVTRVTQVFDLSDPTTPVHIRDFDLVGQEPGATGPFPPQGPHGCISRPEVNRVYCGHGTSSDGVVVILDRDKLLHGIPGAPDPFAPTPENLAYPVIAQQNTPVFMGAHTTFPQLGMVVPEFAKDANLKVRDFIVMVNEAGGNECQGATRQMIFMLDITDEANPFSVASYQVPEASGNFCSRGGRFGAHASNENTDSPFNKKIVFVSWFNAGVRAIDIREPYSPTEVGYFIPPINANTFANGGKFAIQTNNVEVDDRGYVYIVDRAGTGMHILRLTGSAAQIIGH
jgi:hypothetical protein